MDNKTEGQEDGKACCGPKGKCCGKAAAVLALLLVGGAGGFFAGRHCNKVCPTSPSASTPSK